MLNLVTQGIGIAFAAGAQPGPFTSFQSGGRWLRVGATPYFWY
ncbi:MAG: hypothetical protein R3E39_14610 [Anaerolineae bacterium]